MREWLAVPFFAVLTVTFCAFLSDPNSGGIQGSITSRGKTLSFIQPTASPSSSATFLPQAGPFASSGSVDVSSLADLTISGSQNATGALDSTQAAPLKRKTVTIANGASLVAVVNQNHWQIHIWCNTLIFTNTGTITATGNDAGIPLDNCTAGNGGDGAAGGDGGSTANPDCMDPINGTTGTSAWSSPPTFAFDVGGATGGSTGNSAGRGGGGTGSGGNGTDAGGAGGGGGGLIDIVCNTITGSANTNLKSLGGSSSLDSNSDLLGQTNGGGGVIYVAAKSYNGLILPAKVVVTGGSGAGNGSAKIFKINGDNSTTLKAFNQSW